MTTFGDSLALVNACLNGTSALLLFSGRTAIARRHLLLHRRLMISALTVSTVFLISYLTRFYLTGAHPYPGHGAMKTVYFTVLISHMTLAAATPFLAIRSLWLGLRNRIEAHKRLVRYTYPIWLYVSVTGVVVYVMLYA